MNASISNHENRGTNKVIKLIEGKGYLEIFMYLITISSCLVILFG